MKTEGMHVDHRDRNGLNNQKSNLRFCTPAQNHYNKPYYGTPKSGYRGVYLQVDTKSKYAARIRANKNIIQLCGFNSAIEAATAYNELAKKYHGEFAILNQL